MSLVDKSLHENECRICLITCTNRVRISDQNGWFQIFKFCFGIPLSIEDSPLSLCQKCADDVRKFSKLKELCLKTDKYWKSLSNVSLAVKTKPKAEDHKRLYMEFESSDEGESTDPELFASDLIDSDDKNAISMTEKIVNNESFTKNDTVDIYTGNEGVENELLKSENNLNLKTHFKPSSTKRITKIFTCKRCGRNYGKNLWYVKHLRICKLKKVKQSAAYSEFKPDTDRHLGNLERPQEDFNFCGICKFWSNDPKEVTKHLAEHWVKNDLQCMICEFTGKDQAAIAAHRYAHYATKTQNFLCHICSKKTRAQLSLQYHYRKVHLNKTGGLCSYPRCDKVYECWRLWKRHEKSHYHPGYICDMCGKKFRHRHNIVEHLFNHVNPPSNVCDVCGKAFQRLRSLRVHIANIHVKSKRIKCSHCGRMYKNLQSLSQHQRVLAMEKVWKCEFCPMEYPMRSCLQSHLRSHSDERPYCCDICGLRYKAKSVLIIHMRNHTGERPFKCAVCLKAFKSGALLRVHNMIHTGLRPHKCEYCEKRFKSNYLLVQHCNVRHNTLPIITK